MSETGNRSRGGKGRKSGAALAALAVLIVAALSMAPEVVAATAQRVLVLHSYQPGCRWTDDMTRGITTALRDEQATVRVSYEYMDTRRVSEPAYFKLLYQTYRYKFSGSSFNVIIAADTDAFDFLVKYRDELFPGTPVVFCGVNSFEPGRLRGARRFTGVSEAADARATIDLALELHPRTRRIVVIGDATPTGRAVHQEIASLIPAYRERVKFLFLDETAMPQILETVQGLRSDSLVLYTPFLRDKPGGCLERDEGLALIAEKCPVPIYGLWDFNLGYGIVGGMLTSAYYQGEMAGRLAVLILHGEKVENLPVITKSPNRFMFDYRQMARHHIDPNVLPTGSIFVNRPSSQHPVSGRFFWGGIATLAGSALVILSLLHYTLKLRRRGEELRESEARYRIIIDSTYNWEFLLSPEGRFLYTSPSCQRITGRPAEEFLADPELLQGIVHPDDLGLMIDHRHDATWKLGIGEMEFRIVHKNGGIRWIHHVCQPVFDDSGKFLGTRASNADITERKRG